MFNHRLVYGYILCMYACMDRRMWEYICLKTHKCEQKNNGAKPKGGLCISGFWGKLYEKNPKTKQGQWFICLSYIFN